MDDLMCDNCGDAVTEEEGVLVGSDGEVTCPSLLGEDRPHGPAVPDIYVDDQIDQP